MATYPLARVRAAARRGDVRYLIDSLADPVLRDSAARHLGRMQERAAVRPLLRNLRASEDAHRIVVAKALARIADPASADGLRSVARSDGARGVRTTAIGALAVIGDREGTLMLARLAVDPSAVLSGTNRDGFRLPRLFRPSQTRDLRQTRRWAARRLVELGATGAIPVLEERLSQAGRYERRSLRRLIRKIRGRAPRL